MKRILALAFLSLSLTQSSVAQSLEITSEPSNCLVAIDHKIVGRTPLKLEKLSPGPHKVRVANGESFHPFTETIEVEGSAALKRHAVLKPLTSTYLQRGIAALGEGRIADGERALREAVEGDPTQPNAHWWLARLDAERGDIDQALMHARSYAKVFPKSHEVHLLLGDLHMRKGSLAEAVTSYKLALLNSKELRGALDGVPQVTWEAIKEFGQPEGVKDQMRLAYLYELKGMIPEALGWLSQAVAGHFKGWPPQRLLR